MEGRLLTTLPSDWVLHYRMAAGGRKKHEIDLALPAARVAVEIDGPSHCLTAQKVIDRKKEEFCLSRGFRVIRIPNENILTDLEGCVAFILAVAARPAAAQTARPF